MKIHDPYMVCITMIDVDFIYVCRQIHKNRRGSMLLPINRQLSIWNITNVYDHTFAAK